MDQVPKIILIILALALLPPWGINKDVVSYFSCDKLRKISERNVLLENDIHSVEKQNDKK